MGRERQDFKRTTGVRDATLFVVATEGEKTEKRYIEALSDKDHFHSTRVHVEVLATEDGQSSPDKVLSRLNDFKKRYKLRSGDEMWIMIDRDHRTWTVAMLKSTQQLCKQKGVQFGLTNPCFEFWLLLHLEDPNEYDEATTEEVLKNLKTGGRTCCERRLISLLGAYNKSNPNFSAIIPNTELAISRNKELTQNNSVDIFTHLGTTIDALIEKLTNL